VWRKQRVAFPRGAWQRPFASQRGGRRGLQQIQVEDHDWFVVVVSGLVL